MIVSATVSDETISIGEAKENPDEMISVIVRRADNEDVERISMSLATFAAFAGLVQLYLDEAVPQVEDER